MENGKTEPVASRTAEMVRGSESVREPQFRTMQQRPREGGVAGAPSYRRTSVLDSLQPSGNGMSARDNERQMFGMKSQGLGQDTADKSMWLANPSTASLYRALNV